MAWRSSGSSNDQLISNLKRFGVVHSNHVERGFRAVDRRLFVPRTMQGLAHTDQPLRSGAIHISAPHIYGCIVEALDITPSSSLSFLNIGSGTGYLSCVVANILGPTGVCYGVEIQQEALSHCNESLARWKQGFDGELPKMEFIHGNGLNIDGTTGESRMGFDRIYVGAAICKRKLVQLAALLKTGGVLVAPVEDELVKVIRISPGGPDISSVQSVPRSIRGHAPSLSSDYTQQVISGVRFTPLLTKPSMPTILPNHVWGPDQHKHYPESFRKTCKEILLCAHSPLVQPLPQPVIPKDRINNASLLPRQLWIEVLSYTRRDWFEQAPTGEDVLRRQLREEQEALRRAQEARQEAEAHLRMVERERDGYRLLALRWQSRLQSLLSERNQEGDESDRLDASALLNRDPNFIRLNGFQALLQQFQLDQEEQSEEESEEENMDAESQLSDEMEEGEDADMDIAAHDTAQHHVRPARSVSFASGEV